MMNSMANTIGVDENILLSRSETLPGSKFLISSSNETNTTTKEKLFKFKQKSQSTLPRDSSLIDEEHHYGEQLTIWTDHLMVFSNKCSTTVFRGLILSGCLLSNACKTLAGKRNDAMMTKMMRRNYCTKSSNNSLLISIMLPFLLVFLLPSFKLETNQNNNNSNVLIIPSKTTTTKMFTEDDHLKQTVFNMQTRPQQTSIETHTTLPLMSELFLSLARFPFDRLRLKSLGSFVNFVEAKEINNMNHNNIIYRPNDLQEEETHMLIMAPAEHRSSFLAPNHGGGYQQISRSNQRGQLSDHSGYQSGTSLEPGLQMGPPALLQSLAQAQQPQLQNQADLHNGGPDYANGPSGGESGGIGGEGSQGVGSVEGGPESGGGGQGGSLASGSSSSGLQTRGDLPVVRALNVKCEKNHMTVS